MTEGKTVGMKAESAHRIMPVSIVLKVTAILKVAYDGMLQILHVHAYLILASGVEFEFDERIAVLALQCAIVGDSILAAIVIYAGVSDEEAIFG